MNKIVITGRLTKDVSVETTNNGLNYARFTIASKTGNKDENGEKITEFYKCVAWRNRAEIMAKYCKKGNLIIVHGCMQQRKFTNEEGKEQLAYDVIVEDFELLGGASETKGDAKKEQPKQQYEQVDMNDDDFPF